MSQLSLPIQEFYQALSVSDREYAQEQAQEIHLITRNASIQIGQKLIKVKERLGHGKFGKWIELEFQWSQDTANRLMIIASELSNYAHVRNLPEGIRPAHALASALSKEDEEGKQEILEDYQDKLTEKQEEAKSNGQKIPNALSEKEIKELIKEREQLKADLDNLKQANQFVSGKLKEQEQLLIQANSMILSEAKKIAEKKVESAVEAATDSLKKTLSEQADKISQLETEKKQAEKDYEQATTKYQKALEDLKSNPAPETQKAILELKDTYERTKAQVESVTFALDNLQDKENQAFAASMSLERFHSSFKKLIADHPDAITAMSSRYQTDASLARIETLADTLHYWAQTIRNSVEIAREEKAKTVQAIDVEAISSVNYFPEPEDEDEW